MGKQPLIDTTAPGIKHRWGAGSALLIPLVIALSACSGSAAPDVGTDTAAPTSAETAATVSPACAQAFETMRVEYDALYSQGDYTDEEANALEIPPLNACATGEEWIAAGKDNPAALGMTDESAVDETSLEVRCYAAPDTAACSDN